jgi:hypothetical protein
MGGSLREHPTTGGRGSTRGTVPICALQALERGGGESGESLRTESSPSAMGLDPAPTERIQVKIK